MTTLTGTTSAAFNSGSALVDVRRGFGDGSEWEYRSDLSFVEAVDHASARDLGRCAIRRRYGQVKEPHEADFQTRTVRDLMGHFVRVRVATDDGLFPIWYGYVANDAREVYGAAQGDSGVQTWTAYGLNYLLRKAHVHESYWNQGSELNVLGWVPDFNIRQPDRSLVGNRGEPVTGVQYFGGDAIWKRWEMIEYLLAHFPPFIGVEANFGVTGMTEVLNGEESIVVRRGSSVHDIINEIISPRRGVDWRLVLNEDAAENPEFEVQVFTLAPESSTYGGVTIPANESVVDLQSSEMVRTPRVRIERTESQRYRRIAVVGERIVVACSLWSSGHPQAPAGADGSLATKWSTALEQRYKDGNSATSSNPTANDYFRSSPQFEPVYQDFGALEAWDRNGGKASPLFNDSMQLIPGEVAAWQDLQRAMLDWLPLFEHLDYSNPSNPVSRGADSQPGDLMKPRAWIMGPDGEFDFLTAKRGQHLIEDIGTSVYVNHKDFALRLQSSPNHWIAKNHFDGAKKTLTEPAYDYDDLAFTIAYEHDMAFALVVDTGAGDGTMVVEVPDAQLWYLAPDTILDIDSEGKLVTSGAAPVILRDDRERLDYFMAGALARYGADRGRASVTIKGWDPTLGLIGQILRVSEGDTDAGRIAAPVTSVQWTNERDPTTIVSTGYA